MKILRIEFYKSQVQFLYILVYAVLISIFTVSVRSVELQDVSDHVIRWVYNHLNAHQEEVLSTLTFPHGPLAYLQYPLPMGNNYLMGYSFQFLIQFALATLIIRFLAERMEIREGIAAVLCLLLLFFTDIYLSLFLLMLMSAELGKTARRPYIYLVLSALIVALAFYIRAYAGIICGVGYLVHWCFVYSQRPLRQNLIVLFLPLFFAVVIWGVKFGTLAGLYSYFRGFIALSRGSSAATSLYPENDLLFIIPAFLLMTLALVISFKRNKSLFGVLIVIFLLVVKYALSRQGPGHIVALMRYLFVVAIFMAVYYRDLKRIVLALSGILLFYISFHKSNAIESYPFNRLNPVGVLKSIVSPQWDKMKWEDGITRIKDEYGSSEEVVHRIDNATVDCYPWQYYPALSSGFNLKPRPVIQSYAAYTPWLDEQDSIFYASAVEKPEFVIFYNPEQDPYEQEDGRFILNLEPKTMLSLVANYDLDTISGRYFIYRKRAVPRQFRYTESEQDVASWNQWIPVPDSPDQLARIKINVDKNLWGHVSSLLKGTAFYVEYALEDSSVYRYRINPLNAANGIWVNPLVQNPHDPCGAKMVTKVRFKALNYIGLKEQVEFSWQFARIHPGDGEQVNTADEVIHWLGSKANFDCRIDRVLRITDTAAHTVEVYSKMSLDIPVPDSLMGNNLRVVFRIKGARNTRAFCVFENGDFQDIIGFNIVPLNEEEWHPYQVDIPLKDDEFNRATVIFDNQGDRPFYVKDVTSYLQQTEPHELE